MTVLRGRAMSASSPACETLAAATNRRNATGTIGVVATAQSTGPLSGSAWSISSGAVRGHKWAPSSAMDDVACSAVGMDSISDTHHSVGTTAHRSQVAPMPPVSSPANPGSVGQPFLDRSSNNQLGIPNDDPSCSPWIPTDLSRRVDILEQTRGARPGVASQSIRSLRSVDSMKDLENGMPSPPTIPDGEQMTPRSSGKAGSSRGVSDQTASVGVPVYVMLPLDTVTAEGILRYEHSMWFDFALKAMRDCGVRGVAVDVWWGAVERKPGVYDWTAYKKLVEQVNELGLKMQVVLSFHACGGNVGDSAMIPLPSWVLEAGEHDPDLFFTDRPRGNRRGQRNREVISFFADEVPGLIAGRSAMQCYQEFMNNFVAAFDSELGEVIEEVVVGSGPCGELRYPSYVEANGWRFPGVGEFQCYDRRALAQLAKAAVASGHPEWGHAGPHDAGSYNSAPEDTGFFSTHDGSWDSSYGRFFMDWYSGSLVDHGERMLQAAVGAFGPYMKSRPHSAEDEDMGCGDSKPHSGKCMQESVSSSDVASVLERPWKQPACVPPSERKLEVTLKIAGIHWYYRTHSHAAELTAGYYNTSNQNGYAPLIALCAKYGASITLTCVEMCDAQHPLEASCSPEALLLQVRKTAHQMGVLMSGENALPCISPGGVDTTALERIIRNTTAYDPASTPPPLTWGSFAPSSVSMQQLRGSVASFSSNSSMSSCGDVCTESSIATETDQCVLPAMRSFTFLRLNQEMISPAYQGVWMRFMQRMYAGNPYSSSSC